MKVLITGGAGFIGSNLAKGYADKGYDVVIVDNLTTGKEEFISPDVQFHNIDITSKEFVEFVVKENPDVINHHAAQIDVQTSIHNPVHDGYVNILGTVNVLEACRKLENVKLLYPSSAAVYGTPEYLGVDEEHPVKPISFYGISKYTPENYIRTYHELFGIEYSIFRYGNVFGIGQDPKGEGGVISIFMDRLIKGKEFTIFGNGEHTRDYIYVDDIVKANLLASENPCNDVVNISTGQPTSLNELIVLFEDIIERPIHRKHTDERPGDIAHSYLLNDKAERLLGWTPDNSLKEGLAKTLSYYEADASRLPK
jgi:UDP-glucose 4-epimerase